MSSISKFNSALLTVPNEVTIAAANFNLNFSLMKVEAPKEFNGLRDGLSRMRRREAEEGVPHITARTLGALFESVIPSIPKLTAAYGKRVSEISEKLEGAQKNILPAGIFAERAGADGTSIWAAATSGQGAIAMHLLACILARMWKPAEATSLWVELVERRKEEIHGTYSASNAIRVASIMAAQQVFAREQLSAWDSSARSWLQTADKVKCVQQTQLLLIINNVRMSVNNSKDPYESVIKAWTSALSAMERLICGVPQRVQDGAILLAMSSWHLYPNMQVLAEETKDIDQKDELMATSLLTISHLGACATTEGVFWSLPLSKMRYYSPPVLTERHLASETSRISMEEFQIVVLGAVVAQWRKICSDMQRCCRLLVDLYRRLLDTCSSTPSWFDILANAASRVIKAEGPLQAQYFKLLKLGGRRCDAFLNIPDSKPPCFFGLEYFHKLVQLLGDSEDRIRLLRRAAEARHLKREEVIIRYQPPPRSIHGSNLHEFASAVPIVRNVFKRTAEQNEKPSTGHTRLATGYTSSSSVSCLGEWPCGCIDPAGEECICMKQNAACTENCHIDDSDFGCVTNALLPTHCEKGCVEKGQCPGCRNRLLRASMEDEGEEAVIFAPNAYEHFDNVQFYLKAPGDEKKIAYKLILGEGNIAGVFEKRSYTTYDSYTEVMSEYPSATIDEIEAVIQMKSFNYNSIYIGSWWDLWTDVGSEQQKRSFAALSYATTLYASLQDAQINLEVIKTPLYLVSWATALDLGIEHTHEIYEPSPVSDRSENAFSMTAVPTIPGFQFGSEQERNRKPQSFGGVRSATGWTDFVWDDGFTIVDEAKMIVDPKLVLAKLFACLAWFESGEFDIPPSNLVGVMALANGDSIYVASALLEDPSVDTRTVPIRRVFGNLGRPEICLLIPPSNPRIVEPDLAAWKLINHSVFDGKLQDCFGSTSLHLTFTDFEMPLDVGARGLRDRQVVLLESLVSIDDRGKKVADLDILSMLNNDRFYVQGICSHTGDQRQESESKGNLVSLDCWDEFIELPESAAIFRACGNWQARLGAAAAGIQAGKRVLVLSKKPCLRCVEAEAEFVKADILIA